MDKDTWLPKCLSHLSQPYVKETDESVVIGEISCEERNGYAGACEIYTALVPIDRVQEILNHPGGIGCRVESWGPRPSEIGDQYKNNFWIAGPAGRTDRLEPLVVSWEYHNKTVMVPDNSLLMCYGLCPRTSKGTSQIIWDDLSRPEYEVVYVNPLSHYDFPAESGCIVKVNKQYLEDYASLKRCAVVAVFSEERYCALDDELKDVLNGQEIITLKSPGRELEIMQNELSGEKACLCRMQGCRLVLTPGGKPISEEKNLDLEWPDYPGVMTSTRARASNSNFVYVSDQVLEEFEDRNEYQINPRSGSVSYDGWWALSYCHRIARDYVAYEIKKIYEGCPSSIIEHIHRYAVPESFVITQKAILGDENIGERATRLIDAFCKMGIELAGIGDYLGFVFEDSDITSLSKEVVEHNGWWTLEDLKPLGYRVAQDINRRQFLERCKTIYQLIEGMKEKPLRRLLERIGIEKDKIKEFRTLKLFATLLQLCEISLESGLDLVDQNMEVVARWNQDVQLEEFKILFALVDLRNASGHRSLGKAGEEKIRAALEVYKLDANDLKTGWGLAVDRVYDRLTESLVGITETLQKCKAEFKK